MNRRLILISCLALIGFLNSAQAQESASKDVTWYVWIDTTVPINGEMVKIVSNEPMVITCCPKSSKYRKFVKKAAKWIVENVSQEYDGKLSLMKIQDKDLANLTISKLKESNGVRIIDYVAACK